jgi:hypothetical protein
MHIIGKFCSAYILSLQTLFSFIKDDLHNHHHWQNHTMVLTDETILYTQGN